MSMAIALAMMPLYVYLVAVLPARLLKKFLRDGKLKNFLFTNISGSA